MNIPGSAGGHNTCRRKDIRREIKNKVSVCVHTNTLHLYEGSDLSRTFHKITACKVNTCKV